MRHRTSSADNVFHPYKPPAPAAAPKSITFVDTNQQAAEASKGKPEGLQACKPKRKRISPEQLVSLVAVFETTDSPSYDVREKLGNETGMSNREVQVWFQNRRAKVNRERLAAVVANEAAHAAAVVKDVVLPAEVSGCKSPVGTMSAGQHQWRFRPSAHGHAAPPPLPAYAPPPPPSAFPQPIPHPAAHNMPMPHCSYPPPAYPSYFATPSSPYYPAYSAVLTPPLPQGGPASSYFGMPSPSLSTATPSLASPSSASASSYFPYTPNNVASPSGNFFRLTLDSPRSMPALSPQSSCDTYEPDSPRQDVPEPRIELRPIRSSGPWGRLAAPAAKPSRLSRPMHRRSISDSGAHAALLPPPAKVAAAIARPALVRLPSLRGLLNDDEPVVVPIATASEPTSPVEPIRPLPGHSPDLAAAARAMATFPNARSVSSALPKRPVFVSRYSTLDIHAHPSRARSVPFAPQRDVDCARMSVDGASGGAETVRGRTSRCDSVDVGQRRSASGTPMPVLTPARAPMGVGLGMLVAAATELRASDDEKLARLAAAKEMR
ncbi:hypothetical protein JCM10450v2_000704 [Rhodotorula kratochvilovae]